MFQKIYEKGMTVIIENGVIGLHRKDGSRVTCSNVDFYFLSKDEGGYGCKSDEDAADLYFQNFSDYK